MTSASGPPLSVWFDMAASTSTSKGLLILIVLSGLAMLPFGLFNQKGTLVGYALIFVGAVYNRVDSRFRGYKFSLSLGNFSAGLETGRARSARPREKPEAEDGQNDEDDDGYEPLPN